MHPFASSCSSNFPSLFSRPFILASSCYFLGASGCGNDGGNRGDDTQGESATGASTNQGVASGGIGVESGGAVLGADSDGGALPDNSGGWPDGGGQKGAGGIPTGGNFPGGSASGGSQLGGAPPMDPLIECLADEDCPHRGPCQSATCSDDGHCIVKLLDQTPCEDLCTQAGTCRAGHCQGSIKSHRGELLTTLFAFGGANSSLARRGGGAAAFLDENHALYADRLSVGTLLSVVEFEGDSLQVVARYLTSVPYTTTSIGPDVWETRPETHFVSWSPNRFALVNARQGIQTFVFDGSSIRRLDRFWPDDPTAWWDAAATSDGHIWGGRRTSAYQVESDGAVSTAALEIGRSASRLVVGPDGETIYGAGSGRGASLWRSSSGLDPTDLIVDGSGLDLSTNGSGLILLQRAGRHGDKGNIELFDLLISDETPIKTWSQKASTYPYAGTIVEAGVLLGWQRAEGERTVMTLEWSPFDDLNDTVSFVERVRRGEHDNPSNVGRSKVWKNRAIIEPFRRFVEVENDPPRLRTHTGSAQGTLDQATFVGPEELAVISPDSNHLVRLSGGHLEFRSGGMLDQPRYRSRALLPSRTLQSEIWSYPALRALVHQEPVQLLRASEQGVSPVGELAVAPGWLLQRHEDFVAIESRSDHLKVRHLRMVQGDTLLELGKAELAWNPDEDGLTADFDPVSRTLALCSYDQDGYTLRWGHFDFDGSWTGTSLTKGARPESLWTAADRLVVFSREGAEIWTKDGDQVRLEEKLDEKDLARVERILGFDASHLYATERGSGHPTLLTLARKDLRVMARQALPDDVTALVARGGRVVALTKASIHALEPACSLDSRKSEEWPIPDADEKPPPPPLSCEALDSCIAWEAPDLPGDVDRNGCVDATDFGIVTQCQGQSADPCFQSILADLDGDGQVDLEDYQEVLGHLDDDC